ncbi:MAG: ABC transporter permease subunit [Fimbriiglobus sp.]|nr:ABC transporter permease subunit [Fimbriiglobus sp.]
MSDSPPPPRPKAKPKKKPPRAGLIGPLFSWELLRLARRGQDTRGRFILAIALFFVLTAFSLIWFRNTSPAELFFGASQSLTIQESATFGHAFSLTFVFGQMAILCLLTPAYAAGGIAEEKDKKTMVFLLVSELSDREIVFGKFFGRTVFLLGILFAGLPILAITQLHGGVTPQFLLATYAVTAATVVLLSAVSAYSAASAETFRGGLFRAYGLTALIVLAGCGIGPYVSPFAVVAYLDACISANNMPAFWGLAVGFPLLELFAAGLAVWMAVRAVRRLRTQLTRQSPKPPPWVRERYRDEDKEKKYQEQLKKEREEQVQREKAERHRLATLQAEAVELEADAEPSPDTIADGTKRLKARRVVQTAQPLAPLVPPPPPPAAVSPEPPKPTERRWDTEKRGRKGYRDPNMHAAKDWTPKPKIGNGDPFYWKEKHTTGQVKTEDDEAMKGMMYLVGGVLGLIVLVFFGLSLLSMLSGNDRGSSFARWLLLLAGGAGVFAHLLQIGMAACGAICRERQRLTLESLLTIPAPRRAILWPKWLTSLLRGWWWGLPAAAVVAVAFLTTDAAAAVAPAAVYLLTAVPFATSYALWLSVRCPTVNRAVMWFLPVAGGLTAFPIAVCGWATGSLWLFWCVLIFAVTSLLIGLSFLFWALTVKAFDHETILGPGRK